MHAVLDYLLVDFGGESALKQPRLGFLSLIGEFVTLEWVVLDHERAGLHFTLDLVHFCHWHVWTAEKVFGDEIIVEPWIHLLRSRYVFGSFGPYALRYADLLARLLLVRLCKI